MKKSLVYILLGTNLGNRQQNIEIAQSMIANEIGSVIAESSLYESQAWGFDCNLDFYNKLIVVETPLLPEETLVKTQIMEKKIGRIEKTTNEYQSRIIDIDILFYDDNIIESPNLTVPHPQIQNRRFTLLPLCEVAKDYIHPILKQSVVDLLDNCSDSVMVKKL